MTKLEMTKKSKGNSARIFQLKNDVIGSQTSLQEPTLIRDPKSGKIIIKLDEIQETALNFCKELLTNFEPKQGYEKDSLIEHRVHDTCMNEEVPNDINELSLKLGGKLCLYIYTSQMDASRISLHFAIYI